MAFIKKLWKDRISQFPNRRTINDGSVTKQVTVGRDEGTITEPGDTFDASNMNDLEQRIEDAYGDVVSLVASEVAVQYHGDVIFDNAPTTSHGVGYAVTSDGLKTALDGKANTSDIPDELNDLSDVETTTPSQGEALVWDGTKWVNGTVSTVGNLDDLSDVDTTGKAKGDSLRFDGVEWVAHPTTVEMTQLEYDAIVDFTPYENTHIVITDAPNLNPTASDIEYSSGVSVKQAIDSKATNDDYVVVKQTQVSLPSAVSVTAGSKSLLLSDIDITSLGYAALDNITTMGTDYDLVGCLLTWTNNSSCIAVDTLISSGNKVTMNVYAVTSQSVNAVRLLTWWKRK